MHSLHFGFTRKTDVAFPKIDILFYCVVKVRIGRDSLALVKISMLHNWLN